MKKKLLFIYNPRAGKGKIKLKLSDVIENFVTAGYEVVIYSTQGKKDATHIVKECLEKEQYDMVVCSGGDGTLNEIIDGIMLLPEKPKIGYIPAGTTNDFATTLKIPRDILKATRVVIEGKPFLCDIGAMNNEFFTYVVGFGAFTDVSYETSQTAKNMLGRLAYILEGVKRITSLKSYHMVFEHDGIRVEDDFIYGMLANSARVGGFQLPTNYEISLNDGLFEAFFIKMPQNILELQGIINSLLTEKLNDKYFYTFRSDKIVLNSKEPIPWVLDGEFGGCYEQVQITNHAQAVSIMVPDCKR